MAAAGVSHRPPCRTMRAMCSSPAFHTPDAAHLSRRRWLLGAGLGVAMLGAACTGPSGPRNVTLTLEHLQEKLAQRFPRRYPMAGLIELNLQTPRLALLPAQNRLQLVMALEASGVALRRIYTGRMDLDFALRYEPADQTVRATDLRVHAAQIDGLPPQAAQWLGRFGPALAQQALREVVLHQLQAKDLALADSLGLQPGRMTVTPRGLVIELAPRVQP